MAELSALLANHTIIGLDTNPSIYLFERHPRYFSLVEQLFTHLKLPEIVGITSVVTLIATCVQPQREGRNDLVKIYEQPLLNSQQVHMYDIDLMQAKRAVRLRAQYNFRVPDALQLSTALEHGATLFVTNDRRLAKIAEIPVLILDDYL